MKLSNNFSLKELTKSDYAIRNGIANEPNMDQIVRLKELCNEILQPVRNKFGPVIVTSGFRSPQLCTAIGSSINSQHADGAAADFECLGVDNAELADWIYSNVNYDQMILEFYTPGEPNSGWVHCSYSDKPRKQFLLAYRDENGKTKYKPILGKATELT